MILLDSNDGIGPVIHQNPLNHTLEVADGVTCELHINKALNNDPGMVAHDCNTNTWEGCNEFQISLWPAVINEMKNY